MRERIRKIIPVAGLVILVLLFSFTTGGKFFTWRNFQNIIMQSSIALVAATGTVFVMAHNNLDFSLGGACALSSVLAYMISGGNLILFCIFAATTCSRRPASSSRYRRLTERTADSVSDLAMVPVQIEPTTRIKMRTKPTTTAMIVVLFF